MTAGWVCFSGEDLRCKLRDVEALVTSIEQKAQERGASLTHAQQVAARFESDYQEAFRALRDIQDNISSQDSPGVDPATIEEQQKELQVRVTSLTACLHIHVHVHYTCNLQAISDDLAQVRAPIETAQASGASLVDACGVPGRMEVQKHMEDMATALEEIEEGLHERGEELTQAFDKAEGFHDVMQAIMTWLPQAEQKLSESEAISSDPRTVRIQIEEMKVMKVQVHPRYIEIQTMNLLASELKSASPVTAESLSPQVKSVNDRWNDLLKLMYDREVGHTTLNDVTVASARMLSKAHTRSWRFVSARVEGGAGDAGRDRPRAR